MVKMIRNSQSLLPGLISGEQLRRVKSQTLPLPAASLGVQFEADVFRSVTRSFPRKGLRGTRRGSVPARFRLSWGEQLTLASHLLPGSKCLLFPFGRWRNWHPNSCLTHSRSQGKPQTPLLLSTEGERITVNEGEPSVFWRKIGGRCQNPGPLVISPFPPFLQGLFLESQTGALSLPEKLRGQEAV